MPGFRLGLDRVPKPDSLRKKGRTAYKRRARSWLRNVPKHCQHIDRQMTVTSKKEKEANISQMPVMDEAHWIILFSAANGNTLDPVF